MRVTVNENCQGCGVCESKAPAVFEVGDDGFSHVLVDVVPPELEDAVRDAVDECPTESISIVE